MQSMLDKCFNVCTSFNYWLWNLSNNSFGDRFFLCNKEVFIFQRQKRGSVGNYFLFFFVQIALESAASVTYLL